MNVVLCRDGQSPIGGLMVCLWHLGRNFYPSEGRVDHRNVAVFMNGVCLKI